MKQFENARDFFGSIHSENYVILRNFENYPDMIQSNTHEDIDILCENKKQFIYATGALPLFKKDDYVHYYIQINKEKIPVDIRDIEDGYYCRKWAENMLKTKVIFNNMFYVMNNIDYFYSLLYHVIIHKKNISEEYYYRIKYMAKELDINIHNIESLYTVLCDFLLKNQYYVTNSSDQNLFINLYGIDKKLVKVNYLWLLRQKWHKLCISIKSIIRRWIKKDGLLLI